MVERVPFPLVPGGMLRDRIVYDGYYLLLVAHRSRARRYGDVRAHAQAPRAQVEGQISR